MENLELHAAAIVAIPALIVLARQLAKAFPGKLAIYANIAGQLLIAAGVALGMGPEGLGAGELVAGAGVFAGVNFAASWGLVEAIKKAGGDKAKSVIKGKTGTGDGRS